MFWFRKSNDFISSSQLLNQDSFYKIFLQDVTAARKEVVIESPFLTNKRLDTLLPTLRRLSKKNVRIIVNTKPLIEHDMELRIQADECMKRLRGIGVAVLCTGGHHRKIAIIDRTILYEGSLNILSQNDSCEVMRRMYSVRHANEMLNFLNLAKFVN